MWWINQTFTTPFEALYGKRCRFPLCWDEVGERELVGPELVRITNEVVQKVRVRMHTAHSRQKSYADVRRRNLEIEEVDPVFLKVAPMKGILRFRRKGKLSPQFIGLFEILERVGSVAYKIPLPPSLSSVRDVFHVSMLKKYIADSTHVIDYKPLKIEEDLSYKKKSIKILAREVKALCNRNMGFVKLLWSNHQIEEATWEQEEEIKKKYPELIHEFETFEDESSF